MNVKALLVFNVECKIYKICKIYIYSIAYYISLVKSFDNNDRKKDGIYEIPEFC